MSRLGGITQGNRAELVRAASGRRFLTPNDTAEALGVDATAAAQKLARWAEGGWLRRVRRGLYLPVPIDVEHPETWSEDPRILATELWSPCYFTGWTAANHWALTEQPFRTTVVKTVTRVRTSSVHVLGQAFVLIHTQPDDLSWGLTSVWHQDVRLQFADETRTVIDLLDAPRLGGGIRHVAEILATYLDTHQAHELVEYGDRLGNHAVFKRLGYLLEHLGRHDDAAIAECSERLRSGISLLDPSGGVRGARISRWGLRENVRIEELSPS
jgi:predicted transcriptional regulator of viral defense system